MRVFITDLGVLGPAGENVDELFDSLEQGRRSLRRLSLFPTRGDGPRPVAELTDFSWEEEDLPRTHALARAAAAQLVPLATPPDAVVLGGTTGGMPLSEALLQAGEGDPARYALHGTGTVAQDLARELGCAGPALTVSTACSSGAVALKVGLELIRRGMCRTVLAGGVDALCRLTYHGFRLLKLIDPEGARPLDSGRRGMSVGEAAALLLLTGAEEGTPSGALAELRGVGASCDAHHATMPLPGGEGARQAMERALSDAELGAGELDYINLHGTGTAGNDASEAAAVRGLYGEGAAPPLSSTKGITGHPLAAAGALEAAACALCLDRGLLPGNAGLRELDPELGVDPLRLSVGAAPRSLLSNSFGFGGNNAAVVMSRPGHRSAPTVAGGQDLTLEVLASDCLSAAGHAEQTLAALREGRAATGVIPVAALKEGLPPRLIRRLKRLPRMALALARSLLEAGDDELVPGSIYFGTGWGPLSETHDFLMELFDSDEDLSSPTDFVGSVHNAPAGQLAMRYKARGINLTATGGASSFEQCLFMAGLTATSADEPLLLLGADEHHPRLAPLLDPAAGAEEAEGGGAMLARRGAGEGGVLVRPIRLGLQAGTMEGIPSPDLALAGAEGEQLQALMRATGYQGEVLRTGPTLGRHASASAQTVALGVRLAQQGQRSVLVFTGGDLPAATAIWRRGDP